jgi:tetratricopeptide (TPR) repeat protein
MDYLVYAYLQMGQDAKAQAVIEEMRGISGFTETFIAGPYALAVSPARYAIERGDWDASAQLAVRRSPLAHVEAMTHFARAFGAARSGKPEVAKADIAKLAELREKLREAKDAYWAEQVDIQWQVATAWVLYAEGKYEDALKAMSAAADAEDKTDKHPVTPGVPTPARELYGTMLLERGMAKEALAAFEATLKKEPNRLGARVAAEKSNDSAKARQQSPIEIPQRSNLLPYRSVLSFQSEAREGRLVGNPSIIELLGSARTSLARRRATWL